MLQQFVTFLLLSIHFKQIQRGDTDPFLKMKIDHHSLRLKGNEYFKQKEYNKAIQTYLQGICTNTVEYPYLKTEISIIHMNIGVTYYILQEYDKSEEHTILSLLNGKTNKGIHKLCMCYLKQGKYYEAKKLYITKGTEYKESRDEKEEWISNAEIEKCLKQAVSEYIESVYNNFSLPSNSIFNTFFEKTLSPDLEPFISLFHTTNSIKYSLLSSFISEVQKGNIIPAKLVIHILKYSYSILYNLDNIVKIKNKTNQKICVFGDTHGNFTDIVNVLQPLITNNTSDIYLFNGDFVDRGSLSVENLLLILLLKIIFPNQIYLNRGNHEFPNMNIMMGFTEEVKYKYPLNHKMIFHSFCEIYKCMPLATILNNTVFVVHGGLPEQRVLLNEIQSIHRHTNDTTNKIFEGLMWSDPMEGTGVVPSKRNIAVNFGEDITDRFLIDNNLSLIVRSHEYVIGGYKTNHSNKVVTVFSAPNYCGMKGGAAYLVFEENEKYKVINFG